MAIIEVDNLSKTFKVPVREQGLRASMKSLVHRETKEVAAVDSVSFTIDPGEVVGFLGPNGAGKTTTLKMLSGLLHPTGGQCRVLGMEPKGRPPQLLRQITLIMGNRNQLQWDLPGIDSFELNRAIYRIPRSEFIPMRDELIELLDIGDLVTKPVRNLSLGERMKMEIAGALLHRPQVLFLDEPTIGLDITMQRRIRSFVADYNTRHGATVILTSHYMADVQALCKRVIVIHHGRLVFDGDLSSLSEQFTTQRTITARLADGEEITILSTRADTASATSRLLAEHDVVDLTIEDPPIDDVIEQVFAEAPRHIMITMYLAQARSALLQQFQYRAANYFYMIGMIAEPVVYLVVWSTIARAHGGSIDGLTPGGFAAYYIVWTLVRNMNIVLTPFAWEERIKDGTFSGQLMKPVHPIHEDLAQFMGWKVVVLLLWLPIAAVLILLFRPTLSPTVLQCVVFFFAIWGAYFIRAIMQWSLGLITFWTTRVSAIFEAYYLSELLLSGRVFPLVLMPKWFQTVTWFFPFRWCFYFPIVALTGPINDRDLFIGLGMQVGWIVFSIGLLYLVWPRAVRRFSSVGG